MSDLLLIIIFILLIGWWAIPLYFLLWLIFAGLAS